LQGSASAFYLFGLDPVVKDWYEVLSFGPEVRSPQERIGTMMSLSIGSVALDTARPAGGVYVFR
jgi:hypothetical protein